MAAPETSGTEDAIGGVIEGVVSNPIQELSATPNDSTAVAEIQPRRCIVISLIRHAEV